jgi:capsular polysaccharide biosynthesis protein
MAQEGTPKLMNSRRARNFTDCCRAALRHKLVLVMPALVLVIATAAALAKLPNLYKSTSIISLTNDKIGETDSSSRLKDLRNQVTSSESLDAILPQSVLGEESLEAAKANLRRRISIEPQPEPGAFALSYCASDRETARKVTNELADRLVAVSLKGPSSSAVELEALRKRAADISSRLRELEVKDPRLALEDYAAMAPAPSVRNAQPSAELARAQQMTIEGLKDQQYKFQQELADVERRISEQRQIVEQQTKGSALRDNPTYAVLIAKRTELQGQRDTLINRQELTDKHPRVLAINDQIAAIDRQIEELRRQDAALVSQSPEARELASLSSERNRLKIELEVTGRELARRSSNQSISPAPEAPPARRDATMSKLAQEYLGLQRNQKEVAANIQDLEGRPGQEGAAAVELRVLKPADMPDRPISRNRALFTSLAGILGLALGALFVRFAESTRFNSLQDAKDVEHYTRLPLLAAIPKTTTAQERRVARWRANARLLFGTAAAVAVTLALTQIFIATDVFNLIIKK